MRYLAAFCSVLVAAALSAGFWSWLGRSVDVVDLPEGRLECLSYTPATEGASPLEAKDGIYPVPSGLIAADMKALSQYTGCIRTYSMLGDQGDVMAAAAAAGIRVMVGIWIGADDERNEREISRALALADAHPQAVRSIVVGNEVLLRREMTGQRLAGIIRSVKERTKFPVTYADIFEFWRRNPVVAEAVDVLNVHVLPYWDDPAPVGIDDVQARVRGVIDQTRRAFPDKKLEIGEIGWPSAGRTRAGAVPSLVNQARFVREFATQTTALGIPYNLIEAIDQPWKRKPEGTVGGFWGILDRDRQLKFPLTGPVREWPRWRVAAGFSGTVAVLVMAWAAWRGRGMRPWQWIALCAIGPAFGTTLWILADQVTASVMGWSGWLWGFYLMAMAVGGGVLLIRIATGDVGAGVRPASLAGLVDLVRRRAWPDSSAWLGLMRWAVLLPAAILALQMAVDGRHRDFWTLALWLPAVAFACQAWGNRRQADDGAPRAEEGWTATVLLIAGSLGVDRLVNHESVMWAAVCMLLAAPWLGHARAEARRLIRAFRPAPTAEVS